MQRQRFSLTPLLAGTLSAAIHFGCDAPTNQSPPQTAIAMPRGTAAVSPLRVPAPEMEARPLDRPTAVACRISGQLAGDARVALRIAKGDNSYVSLEALEEVTFTLPRGATSTHAFVDVKSYGVELSGWVPAEEVPLYATKTEVLDEFAVPLPTTKFVLRAGDEGAIKAEYPLSPLIQTDAPLVTTKPCAFFSLKPVLVSNEVKKLPKRFGALAPGSVVLHAAPNGRRVATLLDYDEQRVIRIVERRGLWTRILFGDHAAGSRTNWPHEGKTDGDLIEKLPSEVIGWVKSSLAITAPDFGEGWGVGGEEVTSGRQEVPAEWKVAKCAVDLPLVVDVPEELDGEARQRHIVGQVRSGRSFLAGRARGAFVPVWFEGRRGEIVLSERDGKRWTQISGDVSATLGTFWLPRETFERACR